jgi:hypothetical protein
MRLWFLLLTLAVVGALTTAGSASAQVRLLSVTSPASPGGHATLTASVAPTRTCSITVYYRSGPSRAQGLYSKRATGGSVSWTWMVGTRTTAGRWPIVVSCGSAGTLRTSFAVR